MIKLLMTWNIRQGRETEYLEFLARDFAKTIIALGIRPTDAWYMVWGQGPQVLAGGVTEDLDAMMVALKSPEWQQLLEKLNAFVVDFNYKVVEASRGFQI